MMWEQSADCPPVTTSESAPTYHLSEGSFGYAEQRRAEEHDRHIKSDAAGVMHQAGIPREAAKALADDMLQAADALRKHADSLAHDEENPWELTGKRMRAIGDAGGRLVERRVGE